MNSLGGRIMDNIRNNSRTLQFIFIKAVLDLYKDDPTVEKIERQYYPLKDNKKVVLYKRKKQLKNKGKVYDRGIKRKSK